MSCCRAKHPAQELGNMSGWGISVQPSSIIGSSTAVSPATSQLLLAKPNTARRYHYWKKHHAHGRTKPPWAGVGDFGRHGGGRRHGGRRHHHRRFGRRGWGPPAGWYDDNGMLCFVDPMTGLVRCLPGTAAIPMTYGAPGGFMVQRIGSANGPTAGFHDYGGVGGLYGVVDPTQVLESKISADEGTTGSRDLSMTLAALSPAISTAIESISDPYKRVQILEAKLRTAKARGASATKLAKLRAKLDAAKRRLSIKDEALQSTRDLRMLAKVGVGTAIGIGGSLIFLIMMMAIRPRRATA